MRKYRADDERKILTERLVREWFRSGLLDKGQHDRILPELRVDLRRTNLFLRALLFAFGILIILSAVVLAAMGRSFDWETATGTLCLLFATGCFVLAELLVTRFRLYRFGVEEAAAISAAVLMGLAAMFFTLRLDRFDGPGDFGEVFGLIVGSIVAFVIYRRFGYVYAAILSMLCISRASFMVHIPEFEQRLVSSAFFVLVFVVARFKRQESGRDFPSGEYSAIQSAALIGVYAFLNLKLSSIQPFFRAPEFPQAFYWFTYLVIWFVPAIGLYLGLRDRDRPLIDVSGVLALATLITNKPYLSLPRQTWDPILLGVFLIGLAIALRRWLSNGDRSGITASRILTSDKHRLAMVATASAVLQTGLQTPAATTPSSRNLEPGGGRSGGGGASGSF